MALLDWMAPDHDLRLEGDGVRLRPHRSADFSEWADLRACSRAFLQPWEPTWPRDDLTRAAFRRRLSAYARRRWPSFQRAGSTVRPPAADVSSR